MRMLRNAVSVGCFVLCMAGGSPAGAQSGELSGVVVDATGSVLPGATVTLRGGPSRRQELQADAQGRFAFTGLAPAAYTVTVFLSGFAEVTVDDVAVGSEPLALPPITLRLGAFADAAVVTATRIEEPLQEVPMSISAVTGADLERRAIGNLTELSRWTPGLTVVDQGARGSNVVIVRGLHTDALNGSEAAGNNYNNGVATYLGDIPLAVDLRLHDIERVEVLLGPQGTLYGAGTLAGAVRYLPRRPETERRTLDVRGDLFGLAHGGAPGGDAGVTFNLPLVTGKLAVRGSVDRYHDPSRRSRRGSPCSGSRVGLVGAGRVPPAGSAGRGAADHPRAVVRHRPLRLGPPLPGAERPEERAAERGGEVGAGGRRADLGHRLLALLGAGTARPDGPAHPGVRHRGPPARHVPGARAGPGSRPRHHRGRPDVPVPFLLRLHAGGFAGGATSTGATSRSPGSPRSAPSRLR